MAAEQNKKLVERFLSETMNSKNLDFLNELIDPKFAWHGGPEVKHGVAGFKEAVQQFITAFPDIKITAQHIAAEGDLVATRGYMTGTHKGTFMGTPATNKSVKVDYIDFWKFENGKCVENWLQIDAPGLWGQLNPQTGTGQPR